MAKLRTKAKSKKAPKKRTRTLGNATPVKEVERLAKLADDCRLGSKKFSDKIGAEIKSAAKDKHLHAPAFRAALKERRMGQDDPIKLRDYLAALDYYRDVLKIDTLAAPDMLKRNGGMTKLGDAASAATERVTNIVPLVTAMQDAINADNTNKGEMVG